MIKQKVRAAILQHSMLQNNDTVIVALSGGADSVSLLHVLLELSESLQITVQAAHFNHALRGAEAEADEKFVKELCKCEGVLLYIENARMNEKIKPKGETTESWARNLRYVFLQKIAQINNAKIATAHTLSDNAETVIFHAVRGTGPKGLSGIPPVRECFIRPMLEVDRKEVEAYCDERNFSYVIDSTNLLNVYARNRIRNKVLPQLELAHEGAQQALGRLAADMRDLDMFLQDEASKLLKSANIQTEEKFPKRQTKQTKVPKHLNLGQNIQQGYFADELLNAPMPVLLCAMANIAGRSITRGGLERMLQVLKTQRKSAQLPAGKVVTLRQGVLWLEKDFSLQEDFSTNSTNNEVLFRIGELKLANGFVLQVEVSKIMPNLEIFKKNKQKPLLYVADYDKMAKYGIFRIRSAQDSFVPPKRKITKLLRKWMNEMNVPKTLRDKLPLLAANSEVLWVWGAGFCANLQVTENTTQFVTIKCV